MDYLCSNFCNKNDDCFLCFTLLGNYKVPDRFLENELYRVDLKDRAV